MLLLIDAQALQTLNSRNRGVGRYSSALIGGIRSVRPDWQIELIENTLLEPIEAELRNQFPIRTFPPPVASGAKFVTNRELNETFYADWICSQGADSYLCCSLFEHEAVVPNFTTIRPPHTAAVLYDLIPLLFDEEYLHIPRDAEAYAHRFQQLCQMDTLLAISESARNDFLALKVEDAPEVVNIRGATSSPFHPPAPGEDPAAKLQRLSLRDNFILYVGGCDYRKNMEGAIQAYALLPKEVQQRHNLVITCGFYAHFEKYYTDFVAQRGLTDTIKLTGWVSEEELHALYQTCRLFFFPSFYEGLGLPVLEALQSGAPVVCSNSSSLPEYGGLLSHMADPHSPQELAAALQQALAEPRDKSRSERLEFTRQFTWQDTGERTAQALASGAASPRVRRKRPRIAWVSPLPPVRSPIAEYSLELISVLKEQFDIELVVDAAAPEIDPQLASQFVVVTDQELQTRHAAAAYDLFVYNLGDHAFHDYMLPILHRYRGLVVLHDFFLGGLIRSAVDRGYWGMSLEETVRQEGSLDLANLLASGRISPELLEHLSPLNEQVLKRADSVIVHSRWAWQRVKTLADIPVSYLPKYCRPSDERLSQIEQRQQLEIPEKTFVIASFGVRGEASRIESLLQAVSELPRRLRNKCQIILSSDNRDELEKELTTTLTKRRLKSKVQFLDSPSAEKIGRYAVAADVCVQLHYPIRNEITPEMLLALASGACCITSATGPTTEFPNGVTLKVRSPHHEVDDLRNSLIYLDNHPELGQQVRTTAWHYVRANHTLAQFLPQFGFALAQTLARRADNDQRWFDRITACIANSQTVLPENLAHMWSGLRSEALQVNASLRPSPVAFESLSELNNRKKSA